MFEPLLRIVCLAFEYDQGTRQLVHHFRATAFQLFLPATQLFELTFLLLDLFLLALKLEQLLLCFLHLGIEVLGGQRLLVAEFQHLLNRSNFFRHDKSCSPPWLAPARILSGSLGEFQIFLCKKILRRLKPPHFLFHRINFGVAS